MIGRCAQRTSGLNHVPEFELLGKRLDDLRIAVNNSHLIATGFRFLRFLGCCSHSILP